MARTSPDLTAQIVAMRSAGWTLNTIAQKVGVSVSSVKRICNKHSVIPGSDQQALVADARRELLSLLTDDEKIRAVFAALAFDTISHVEIGRAKAVEAIEHLTPIDTKSAALTLRGVAAHATATKAYADVVRALLPAPERDPDTLPVLTIETLTAKDIEEMREQQRQEDAILNSELGAADDIDPHDDDNVVEIDKAA